MTDDPRPIDPAGWTAPSLSVVPMPTDDELVAEMFARRDAEWAALATERWAALCPARFLGASWSGIDQPPPVMAQLSDWRLGSLARQGANLLLFGGVGVGKTYAAVAAALEHHNAGMTVAFVPVVELLDALRPGGDGDLSTWTDPDLLVLDDLGGEKPSEWTVERLYAVVNRRWLDQQPTVVTTNLEAADLKAAIGERTYDRLRDGAVALRLGGKSRRGQR